MHNAPFTTLFSAALLLSVPACGDDDPMTDDASAMDETEADGKTDDADGKTDDEPETDETTDTEGDDESSGGGSSTGDAPEPDPNALPCDPDTLGGEPIRWVINDDFEHTAHTRTLPLFDRTQPLDDGLVRIEARGLEFRARVYGMANEGPGVVMIHGFPSSSIMWDHAAQAAADAGYRVVAFDQRGYSPDARPEGVESYLVTEFVDDVEAIADAVGFDRFNLVGHDVGCVVSWVHATIHGDRLDSMTCVSVSHPATLADTIINDPPEYIQLFSLPNIPETVLAANNAEQLRSQYAFMNEAECREYNQLFMEPDALRATIDFYRGITASLMAVGDVILQPVDVPTLFVYGTGEQWVTPETLAAHPSIVTADYTEVELSDAGPTGHFVVEARRERVTELVLEHLDTFGG
ncbi:MAG: alpha/beta hydrolase [Myxococcota bacterium]